MDDDDWFITGLLAGVCVVLGVILLIVEIGRLFQRLLPKRFRWPS